MSTLFLRRPFSTLARHGASIVCLLAAAVTGAHAEDIDIYNGVQAGGSSNLIVVLDNAAAASGSSSFSCPTFPGADSSFTVKDSGKNFGFEQCGLYGALVGLGNTLTASKQTSLPLNMGLMYFPGGSTDGGQFVLPTSPNNVGDLIQMDSAGIASFKTRVAALSLSKDKSNNNQASQALQEGFAFYNGLTGLSGTSYGSLPADLQSCGKNYIVYITLATNNQKPQDGGKLAQNRLQSTQGSYSELTLPAYRQSFSPYAAAKAKYQSDPSDEWARFMSNAPKNPSTGKAYNPVTTFTIVLYDGSNPDYEQLMSNVADQGGSKAYFVKLGDTTGLQTAIEDVIRQVMAVNSVFAAPVLPVSANTQGTYANQVYMGMFRPDENGLPRWVGNLKQFQFGLDLTNKTKPVLFLADATGKGALSSAGTGFITPTATSFWTSKNDSTLPDSKGGFWADAVAKQGGVDGKDLPDGQVVEKGGVSQRLRLTHLTDLSKRNVFTCAGTGCVNKAALSTMAFNTGNTNITDTLLGTGGSTGLTRNNLIRWVRGEDVYMSIPDTSAGPETSDRVDNSIKVRGSIHGDVLHSRPAVINYGSTYGTVVFYGANDGTFRAINGNQPNNPSNTSQPLGSCTLSTSCAISTKGGDGSDIDVPPGGELWSFIPTEFYGGLKRIYQNNVELTLGDAATAARQPKTYFFDGSPSVYQNGSTAYLFLSARRGGRMLYALDISNPTTPKFMWKHSNTDTGFGELGQTWSQPKVAMIKGYTNPVLIFGAGYDPNQDNDVVTLPDAMGRGIMVLDAVTGDVVWQAKYGATGGATCKGTPCQLSEMKYSIPADITLVDRNYDGLIDRLYAADLGGNLWRVDLATSISDWQVTQIAALGGTGTTKRKFFFPPDVVVTKNFDAVVAISGDREHPLLSNTANSVVNRFYMIKDTQVSGPSSSWVTVHDDTLTTANTKPADLYNATASVYDNSGRGFYMSLLGSGEKGVNAPTTFGGSVYFGTNRPIASTSLTCQANLGEARGYTVNFVTGASKSTVFDGGGLPPSPVTGVVEITHKDGNGDTTTSYVPFVIGGGGGTGADAKSALGGERVMIPIPTTKRRTYWYRLRD